MGLLDWLKKPTEKVKLERWQKNAIRLQTQKLSESVEIVNTSCNFDSAVEAFDTACTALGFLSDFTDEEIRAAGCSISKSPGPYLSYLRENREELLEAVRSRSHSFAQRSKLHETDFSADYHEESPAYEYLAASSRAIEAGGDAAKMQELECQVAGFPSFVKSCFETDGDLPPFVHVRDSLPELYMRFGLWEKAESVVHLCISCDAYGHTEYRSKNDHKGRWIPEDGEAVLAFLRLRHEAADAALAYLSENPGTLQSKIYKAPALALVDHDSLVWFCRNSHQIRKEKDGKTNRIYIADGVPK